MGTISTVDEILAVIPPIDQEGTLLQEPSKEEPLMEVNGITIGDWVVVIAKGSFFSGRRGVVITYPNQYRANIEVVGASGISRIVPFSIEEFRRVLGVNEEQLFEADMSSNEFVQSQFTDAELSVAWLRLLVWASNVILPTRFSFSLKRIVP